MHPQLRYFVDQFFDPKLYCAYKALQFFRQKENGGYSSKTIRANMKLFSSSIGKMLKTAHLTPWEHYQKYGTTEGINPSDAFDTKSYLKAKAKAWNKSGKTIHGKPYRPVDIARTLRAQGITALEDFLLHAGTEPCEVKNGLNRDGSIPEEFSVPENLKIRKKPAINPKNFFNEAEYLQYKAIQFFGQKKNGNISRETVLKKPEIYVLQIMEMLKEHHTTAWEHFQKFGTLEKLNPSNLFDTEKYLAAKAAILNEDGDSYTTDEVAAAIHDMQMTVLDHFLIYAGKAKNEVPFGVNPDGTVPRAYQVDDPVPPLNLKKLQKTKKPQPLPVVSAPKPIPVYDVPVVTVPTKKRFSAKTLYIGSFLASILFVFCYLSLIASPSYISEMKFAVKGQEKSGGMTDGLSAILNMSTPTQNDSYIILDYIQSQDMIARLEKKFHIVNHYADPDKDIWYRLEKNPTKDTLWKFWQWACEAAYDPDTNILQVSVKAFSPEMALRLCRGILEESERLVNDMNTRARKDTIDQAKVEVMNAENRLRFARQKIREFRDKTVILDPGAVATGLYTIINSLENELTQTRAELAQMKTFMSEQSPRVKHLTSRIKTLEAQLETEKHRLAGKVQANASLNDVLSDFQALMQEEEFAKKQFTQAMTSLETARVRADAKTQYVEAFEEPGLADESLYPKPLLFTFIYTLTAVLLTGLCSLVIASIREHAGW